MTGSISHNAVPKFSFSETASSVGNGIKTGFNWCIDKITLVASTIFSFLRDTALPAAKNGASKTVAFLRTNAGAALSGAFGTAGLLYAASKKEGDENEKLRNGLYFASGITAALTVAATVFGYQKGFSANIV